MKKYLNYSLVFAILGLASGVYFRELTKFNNFTQRTMLGMVHPHLLMLGMGGFLLIALFFKILNIEENNKTGIIDIVYITGLSVTSAMMLLRGSMEVVGTNISSALSSAVSGISGIGHILFAAGFMGYLLLFQKADR